MRLNVLLVPIGTDGDVYPYVGLGVALADRGHRVTLIANEHFRPLAQQHGFGFVATGTSREYDKALDNPHILTNPVRGALPLRRLFCTEIPKQYHAIASQGESDSSAFARKRRVILAAGFAAGARMAHEKLGIPWAVIALQPMVLPLFAKLPHVPDWLPGFGKRFGWRVSAIVGELIFGQYVRPLRTELGLPPIRHLPPSWWLSPKVVIGLFPQWYAGPQPRWSVPTELTGFVAYDATPPEPRAAAMWHYRARADTRGRKTAQAEACGSGASAPTSWTEELESFLAAGEPPIVFTPGSEVRHANRFFEVAIEACTVLGKRGLLLTRHRDQLPGELPTTIRHFDYVPLGKLLPRTAGIVHHGGIGTTARAMAAGVPQLVAPRIYDQPDNARRIKKLGIGDYLSPRAFRGLAVAKKLSRLLNSHDVVGSCRAVAAKCKNGQTLHQTCELIERMIPD